MPAGQADAHERRRQHQQHAEHDQPELGPELRGAGPANADPPPAQPASNRPVRHIPQRRDRQHADPLPTLSTMVRAHHRTTALSRSDAAREPASRAARSLLLHAFPLNARMWEPQLALAERGWRVIAPQLRGVRRRLAAIRRRRRSTTTPATSSICSTRCTSSRRWSAGCRWAATSRSRCCATPRATFRGWSSPTRGRRPTRPKASTARKRMLQRSSQRKGPPAVADEMIPKLLGDTTRRDAAGGGRARPLARRSPTRPRRSPARSAR